MARLARVVAVGVTAPRYPAGECTPVRPCLRLRSQSLPRFAATELSLHGVDLIGYCLMSNHVHLIAVPQKADVLGLALKNAHGRYAAYWNASHHSTGHVWQGRYYSCPLDEPHLWGALRYTELNPVRAAWWKRLRAGNGPVLLATAAGPWGEEWLAMEMWQRRWCDASWRAYLDAGQSESKLVAIRRDTHTGRPLGGAEFVRALERETKRLILRRARRIARRTHAIERSQTFAFNRKT
jgi:putative transposase